MKNDVTSSRETGKSGATLDVNTAEKYAYSHAGTRRILRAAQVATEFNEQVIGNSARVQRRCLQLWKLDGERMS
jgi:hypothetical protein